MNLKRLKKISIRTLLTVLLVILLYIIASIILTRRIMIHGSISGDSVPVSDAQTDTFQHALVSGTSGGEAQEIALRILENGGNAMDASLAMSMAQIVASGGTGMSFAGRFVMLYYDAESEQVYCLNASFNSPLQGVSKESGQGRFVPVPGFLKGVEAAHSRFGSLAFNQLIQPSVDLATNGIIVNEILGENLKLRKELFRTNPESYDNFLNSSGEWAETGDTLIQDKLANTLRQIRDNGINYFYKGPWAQKAIKKVNAIGGNLSQDDFDNYKAIWCEPIHTKHNGYDIFALGYPSFGGYHLLEALNTIECADLKDSVHYGDSPESLFWLNQIFKISNHTRIPGQVSEQLKKSNLDLRINKEYNREEWKNILVNKGYKNQLIYSQEMPHTDAAIVIDSLGNMAAILHSSNTYAFGETGLIVDGISIPDAMHHQMDIVNSVEPGTRIPDPGTPLIVLKDGKAYGCFSSIGSGLQTRMISVIYNLLDFGMSPDEALSQPALGPAFHFNGNHFLWGEYQTVHTGKLSTDYIKKLEKMGIGVIRNDGYSGFVSGAIIDTITQVRTGLTTNQLDGKVLGN